MVNDYSKILSFIEKYPSPLLSCCVDDGEFGIGWYVDATDNSNNNAINLGFFKHKIVAMAFCESIKRIEDFNLRLKNICRRL